MKSIKRGLKALALILLSYLFQACVMEHLAIRGVAGSMVFAMLAVLTVSCGKRYAFCASCLVGMLMESMLSSVSGLYVIAYPVITMLCAQSFADMSDRQLERRRMAMENRKAIRSQKGRKERWWNRLPGRNRTGDLPAHLRIPLCAAAMDLILNVVLCVYMYLIGEELSLIHAARTVISVLYTAALAVVVMVPARYVMGMYPRRKKRERGGEEA